MSKGLEEQNFRCQILVELVETAYSVNAHHLKLSNFQLNKSPQNRSIYSWMFLSSSHHRDPSHCMKMQMNAKIHGRFIGQEMCTFKRHRINAEIHDSHTVDRVSFFLF